jgi:hypothetical protein
MRWRRPKVTSAILHKEGENGCMRDLLTYSPGGARNEWIQVHFKRPPEFESVDAQSKVRVKRAGIVFNHSCAVRQTMAHTSTKRMRDGCVELNILYM